MLPLQITFKKIGIAAKPDNESAYLTLKEILTLMGDSDKNISYLKVDIEGFEIDAIPEWISSGILDRVSQIGIELHTGRTALAVEAANLSKAFSKILNFLRELHKIGFRIISNANNDCVEKSNDDDNRYLSLMEVVFYKES